jgi:hypothetical protein
MDEWVRTPLPRISGLALTVVHDPEVDMLLALGDKGKGEAMGQNVYLPHINRGLS